MSKITVSRIKYPPKRWGYTYEFDLDTMQMVEVEMTVDQMKDEYKNLIKFVRNSFTPTLYQKITGNKPFFTNKDYEVRWGVVLEYKKLLDKKLDQVHE